MTTTPNPSMSTPLRWHCTLSREEVVPDPIRAPAVTQSREGNQNADRRDRSDVDREREPVIGAVGTFEAAGRVPFRYNQPSEPFGGKALAKTGWNA
jgi:hypothetical protein